MAAGRKIDAEIRFRKVEETDGFSTQKVTDLLEKGYLSQRREDKWTQKKSFAPSSLAYGKGVCPRYWYLAFDGNEFVETNDAKSIPVMGTGTTAGVRIANAFRDSGALVADEQEVLLQDPPIRGFIDVIVKIGTEEVVGEIKTTSQEIFTLKQVSKKPSPAHLLQILIYLKATGKKKGFILYENRNDLSVLVLEINFDEKNEAILETVLDWMRVVRKHWEDRELPKRPYRSQTVKVCQDCPLNKVCWEDTPEGEFKVPKMEIPVL